MRISDWSSDVCSSDLETLAFLALAAQRGPRGNGWEVGVVANVHHHVGFVVADRDADPAVVMQRDAGLGLTVGDDEVPAGCGHQINVSIFAPFRIFSLAHRGRRLVSAHARRSPGDGTSGG